MSAAPFSIDDQAGADLVLALLLEGEGQPVHGDFVAGKLGVEPTDVYRRVEALRERGFKIAASALGYRVIAAPDRLEDDVLSPLLDARDVHCGLHCLAEVGSTNEEAARLAADGAPSLELVVAEAQTAGRGRRGRAWASPPGVNVYLSLLVRPELPAQRAPELSLVAAVATCEAIRAAGVRARLKWPNDVLANGKKLAGILCEVAADERDVRHAILGVGVNVNARLDELPEELRAVATSMLVESGAPIARPDFAADLVASLTTWLARHDEEGFGPVAARWRELSSTLGAQVVVREGGRVLRGRAADLDDDGALLVATDEGLERILAGDVEELRTVEGSAGN